MNSKTLFVYLRKDKSLFEQVKPVMVHVNYHSDKFSRFQAVVARYVNGDGTALDRFSDATL
jgi:arabinosyltransferase